MYLEKHLESLNEWDNHMTYRNGEINDFVIAHMEAAVEMMAVLVALEVSLADPGLDARGDLNMLMGNLELKLRETFPSPVESEADERADSPR